MARDMMSLQNKLALFLKEKGQATPTEINDHLSVGEYATKYVLYARGMGHKINTTKNGREVLYFTYVDGPEIKLPEPKAVEEKEMPIAAKKEPKAPAKVKAEPKSKKDAKPAAKKKVEPKAAAPAKKASKPKVKDFKELVDEAKELDVTTAEATETNGTDDVRSLID